MAGTTQGVGGAFGVDGYLRILESPAGADGTVSVSGFPRDDYGMWQFLPPVAYRVCFGPAPGTPRRRPARAPP